MGSPAGQNVIIEQIKSIELFKSFSAELVKTLSEIATVESTLPGKHILVEGQTNDRLMILLSGRVEVLVEGEPVAVLSTPGDLMGEISVFTARPITASLVALTPVEYLSVSIRDLGHDTSREDEDFGYQLYKTLSWVLSEKIIRTNQKARKFEIANRDLLAAKAQLEEINRTLDLKVKERTQQLRESNIELENRHLELVTSHRKLEELYSTKDVTFKKLSELQEAYLIPLRESVAKLESKGAEEKAKLERVMAQIDHSIEILKPLSELYSTEQAIRSRHVLLAEDDSRQMVASKLALSGSGVQLELVKGIDKARALLAKEEIRFDLAFVSTKLSDLIPEILEAQPKCKVSLMISSDIAGELSTLRKYANKISNVVSRHPEDRTFTVKNVATTASKLVSDDFFGLEKYLIWGVDVQSQRVANSTDREPMIAEMKKHFASVGVRGSIGDRAALVSEELLMNAIYDAPTDDSGKAIYNHLPRTEKVHLKPQECGEFRYACDGMFASVSVSDPFGAFKIETLLNYLERNYSGNLETGEKGKGGAGKGLHIIIENSDLVVFNVHKNVCTEVIALFNLDPSQMGDESKPSFHFFLR